MTAQTISGKTLPAKVLAMRRNLRDEVADLLDDTTPDASVAAIATTLADWLIDRGWVHEHPDAGLSPYQPDEVDEVDEVDDEAGD